MAKKAVATLKRNRLEKFIALYGEDPFNSPQFIQDVFDGKQRGTCPHCNVTNKGIRMSRSHYDNCKKKI